MAEERKLKHWVINEQELGAIQEFIGSLALPWKQTNPYMQLLGNLKLVNYQAPAPVPASAPPAPPANAGSSQKDHKKESNR